MLFIIQIFLYTILKALFMKQKLKYSGDRIQ